MRFHELVEKLIEALGVLRKLPRRILQFVGLPKVNVKPEWMYAYHAVAYLDLMGQRQLFQSLPGVPKPEDGTKLIEILKQTIGFIRQFRKGFKDLFSAFQEIRNIPNGVPTEFHDEYRRMQQAEIHLQSVSDAVVVWSPIHTTDDPALSKAMNSVWGILLASCGMTLISLASKHPLRGGIEVDGGITIEPGGTEIYGRALNQAYDLERCTADFPRIVVGDGLIHFLDSVENEIAGSSRFLDHSRAMAKKCRELILTDQDGQKMLHFLGSGARQIMLLRDTEKLPKDVVEPAYAFVNDSVNRFREDAKLGPRYLKLKAYFDKYVPEWPK